MEDTNFDSFVKSQLDYHRRSAERFKSDPIRNRKHSNIVARFEALHSFLLSIPENQARKHGAPPVVPKQGVMRIGSIDELPKELIDQLSITESDHLEFDIISVVDGFGGAASIDEILVGLWRKTQKVTERAFLSRKLYRMAQQEKIWPVQGRKGIYATTPVEVAENDDDEILDDL